VLGSVLVALGSFDAIVAYFIFVTVVFIALTVVGLFRLRRREDATIAMARRREGATPQKGPIFQTPGFPGTAFVFLALVTMLLVMLVVTRPVQALAGMAIVLVGLPVYALIERQRVANRPSPEA
jgi:APA family basic amino acid/polyamine antiporter